MLYDDKAPEILKQYEVRAFPTFIVTDAEGTEEMRQVGAPFSTPEDAIEWFPGIIDALDNLPEYEKAHKAKPEDLDAALKLAEAYNTLGRGEDSLKIYTAVAPKIEEEDERYVDVQLAYADALMGTMSRDNEAEVGGKIGEIYDSLLPDLIEAKDERAVDPGVLNARIKAFLDDDFEGAREQIHALTAAFAEHDRATEMKFFAAYFAQMDEDFDTAKAEYQAIIDAGEADDNWVKNAKKQLEAIEMDAEEKKDTEE